MTTTYILDPGPGVGVHILSDETQALARLGYIKEHSSRPVEVQLYKKTSRSYYRRITGSWEPTAQMNLPIKVLRAV